MNQEKETAAYFKKLQGVKLSEASKLRMEKELLSYARFHGVDEDSVRVADANRSMEQVPSRTSFLSRLFNPKRNHMHIFATLMITILIGGGTSLAAESALPGDVLYPVKVSINERVKGTLAFSSEAEARLQAELLEERLREAEQLQAAGKLEGETAADLEVRVAAQAESASLAAEASEASVAVRTKENIRIALEGFNALLYGDDTLAVDSGTRIAAESSGEATADDSTSMTSMLALDPISVEVLIEQTEVRIEALRSLINEHEAELSAKARAEFKATLDEAATLLVDAEAKGEAEARELVFAASDLAGEVESALSLLGTVTIDPETGAIVDIDFSVVPQTDRPIQGGTSFGGGVDSSGSGQAEHTTDAVVETDLLDAEASVESESDISL